MHVEWTSGGEILADGQVVAQVERSFFREQADVDIAGEAWVFGKDFGALTASRGEHEVMRADKVGFFGTAHELRSSTGHVITLEKSRGFFSSGYTIRSGDTVLAEIESSSMWMTQPAADFPENTPLPDAVFVLWAVYILMKRAQSAATS